jgi:hypothetical protein
MDLLRITISCQTRFAQNGLDQKGFAQKGIAQNSALKARLFYIAAQHY